MADRRTEFKRIAKEVALENTGYERDEADAWAMGLMDALQMTGRVPCDEHAMRDFAIHAARL